MYNCVRIIQLALTLLLASVATTVTAKSVTCQEDNASLQAMPLIEVTMTRSDNTTHTVTAKLADNNQTRAAGFQRVCASTIAATPILFVFKRPLVPQFHMYNVVAPIDIAFIDAEGQVESIHAMLPYVLGAKEKPLYSPSSPIIAAFEAAPGFFDKIGVDTTAHIRWQSVSHSK